MLEANEIIFPADGGGVKDEVLGSLPTTVDRLVDKKGAIENAAGAKVKAYNDSGDNKNGIDTIYRSKTIQGHDIICTKPKKE